MQVERSPSRRGFRVAAGALALATGLLASSARAQPGPMPPPGAPCPTCAPPPPVPPGAGPIQTAFHHAAFALKDNLIGYPEEFYEPPVGAYINTTFRVMKAKADPHRFTLYKTDFLAGSNRFSPVGATRFNLMASRLALAPGPIIIEWSPDEPGMAELRRDAVLRTFHQAGIPIAPNRVVIAPAPYPGGLGTDGANYYNVMIVRDQAAPGSYSLTPVSASGFGGSR